MLNLFSREGCYVYKVSGEDVAQMSKMAGIISYPVGNFALETQASTGFDRANERVFKLALSLHQTCIGSPIRSTISPRAATCTALASSNA